MPLQKQFQGLSDFLGRYEAGNLSMELIQAIQPQLDISDFLEPPQILTALHSVGSLGAFHGPTTAPTIIPDNEIWRISILSAKSTGGLASGQNLLMNPVAILPSLTERVSLGSIPVSAFTITSSPHLFSRDVIFETPLLFGPGFEIGFIVDAWSGTGTAPVQVSMRYQKIRI